MYNKRNFIFLFLFLNLIRISKSYLKDEILVLKDENKEYLIDRITDIRKNFSIDINILITDKVSSIENFVNSNKKSIFIFVLKEKDKIRYSIFLSKYIINQVSIKEIDSIIDKELSILIKDDSYFNFFNVAIGRITDIYISSLK